MLQLCKISPQAKPNSKYLMFALMKQCKIFRKRRAVGGVAPQRRPACQKHPLRLPQPGLGTEPSVPGTVPRQTGREGRGLLPSGLKWSGTCAPPGMPRCRLLFLGGTWQGRSGLQMEPVFRLTSVPRHSSPHGVERLPGNGLWGWCQGARGGMKASGGDWRGYLWGPQKPRPGLRVWGRPGSPVKVGRRGRK